MSKVVRIYQHGGPEELRFEDLDVGEPGPDEVRVKIEAIGLNRSTKRRFVPFEQIVAARRYLESNQQIGKIDCNAPPTRGFAVLAHLHPTAPKTTI